MNLTLAPDQSRFQFVCEQCGSMSVILPPRGAPSTAQVICAGCDCVRGTMEELYKLASDGRPAPEL